jgi:TRAP-type C4-dicarboxylate transport system permease small subunit
MICPKGVFQVRNFVIKTVTKGLEYGTILSIAGITLILSVNVILRYFFSRPFPWAEEVSVLLIVWAVFLGAALVQKNDEHVAITYLFDRFPDKWKNVTLAFGNLCIVGVLVVHFLSGINLLKLQMGVTMTSVDVSMAFFAMAVLVGMGAMLLFTVNSLIKNFGNKKP